MLIGSLCDSGSTHSVWVSRSIFKNSIEFQFRQFSFLFRNKFVLILILILSLSDLIFIIFLIYVENNF